MAYISIDDFLSGVKPLYKLSKSQEANFKRRMKGKQYMESDSDFLPYLQKFMKKEG